MAFQPKLKLAVALRDSLKEGYSLKRFSADLQAGVIVGIVAIPLAMALAIASGVAPQYGLYTVVIAGLLVPVLGGSRHQITGPTAAFVVLLLPVVQKFGLAGLLSAGFLAGLILIAFALMRLGDAIQYIPHPVTTGFTSAIALVIATLQLKDFFSLDVVGSPSRFIDKVQAIFTAIPTLKTTETAIGLATLCLLFIFVRFFKRTPAPIFALTIMTAVVGLVQWIWPEFHVQTIATRFSYLDGGVLKHGIPQSVPALLWPWQIHGASFPWTLENLEAIFPSAFAIALLGAIESLLSATVADGMTRRRHSPNEELMALGIGNLLCPFFGGIPVTGAIARTTTNIRFGGTSPISAVVHALVVLLILVSFAPVVGLIPMASLAALLLFVAYNMAEKHHFANILKIGSPEDKLVLLVCFTLTVLFDMTIGVGAGVVLASLLFIRRISRLTAVQTALPLSLAKFPSLPKEIFLYRISGPLFFGAAHKAVEAIGTVSNDVRVVVLDLSGVQLIDVTGLVAVDSAIYRMHSLNRVVFLVITDENLHAHIRKLKVFSHDRQDLMIFPSLDSAVLAAHERLQKAMPA